MLMSNPLFKFCFIVNSLGNTSVISSIVLLVWWEFTSIRHIHMSPWWGFYFNECCLRCFSLFNNSIQPMIKRIHLFKIPISYPWFSRRDFFQVHHIQIRSVHSCIGGFKHWKIYESSLLSSPFWFSKFEVRVSLKSLCARSASNSSKSLSHSRCSAGVQSLYAPIHMMACDKMMIRLGLTNLLYLFGDLTLCYK